MPLLERAIKETNEISKVRKEPTRYEVRSSPWSVSNDIQRQVKKASEAVEEIITKIKPNPRRQREAERLKTAFGDQILATRAGLHKTGASPNENEQDNNLLILDALKSLRRRGYRWKRKIYLSQGTNHSTLA